MTRELTGRHVLIIALAAFGVILAANLTMLFSATGSFPGLVSKNAYAESLGWNGKVAAQEALGWHVTAEPDGTGVTVVLTGRDGAPVGPVALEAMIGRPSTDIEDRALELVWNGAAYRAETVLAPGGWRLELRSTGETPFRKTLSLFVAEAG